MNISHHTFGPSAGSEAQHHANQAQIRRSKLLMVRRCPLLLVTLLESKLALIMPFLELHVCLLQSPAWIRCM